MKILIGCDESSSADKLYYDLKRAGLPDNTQAYVLSVADVFIIPGYEANKSKREPDAAYLTHIDREISKAQQKADDLAKKLRSRFPSWHFNPRAAGGSPAREIVNKAREWEIDLIVVGSHGRPGLGEFFFGSVALTVLSAAPCSVRIVRPKTQETDSPSRLIIAVDGSKTSEAAIDLLTKRSWMKVASIHLVTAIDSVVYTAFLSYDSYYPVVAMIAVPDGSSRPEAWIKKMHEEYKEKLEKYGLIVSSLIKEGEPKKVLLEETKIWGADCILMGAVGHSSLERLFMGSVSSAIAARAHCSVEIFREPIV